MESFIINGGNKLYGTINASGAKNAALPAMAAALLTSELCHLENIPCLSDIDSMADVLKHIGVYVSRENNSMAIQADVISSTTIPQELVSKMRASIYVMAPLLATRGYVCISEPGGCLIGSRPIDIHLRTMKALGCSVEHNGDLIHIKAPTDGLKAADFSVAGPNGTSVGATCNAIMATVLANGESTIRWTACEPEVEDLIKMLNNMGAKILRDGPRRIIVQGVKKLYGALHYVISDRIEVGTYLIAAAMTGGDVTVKDCDGTTLIAKELEMLGANVSINKREVRVNGPKRLNSMNIKTMPYPGFPTDLQPQMVAALSIAKGNSVVTDLIFKERFTQVSSLINMGANITISNGTAKIKGVKCLLADDVYAQDLRGAASLVLAGLVSKGGTICHDIWHLDRGYEKMDNKLNKLGAEVIRMDGAK